MEESMICIECRNGYHEGCNGCPCQHRRDRTLILKPATVVIDLNIDPDNQWTGRSF